mgnify:CR=1 FL=1
MKKRDPGADVGIDVVGDIHGYADHLKALLEQMGYRKTKGAYRHDARTALAAYVGFLGGAVGDDLTADAMGQTRSFGRDEFPTGCPQQAERPVKKLRFAGLTEQASVLEKSEMFPTCSLPVGRSAFLPKRVPATLPLTSDQRLAG